MKEIRTERLLLRQFQESDYDDLFEFLSQLKDDEFEGFPGITYENGRKYLQQRLGSEEFYAVVLPGSGKVIGNIFCGNREFDAKEVGYIISTGTTGEWASQKKLFQRSSGTLSGRARTESLQSVIRGTWLPGSFWRKRVCSGKLISGRTSGFIKTKMAVPSGRTLMYMQN